MGKTAKLSGVAVSISPLTGPIVRERHGIIRAARPSLCNNFLEQLTRLFNRQINELATVGRERYGLSTLTVYGQRIGISAKWIDILKAQSKRTNALFHRKLTYLK
ncbi:hypothetical protein [Yoonia sp.]|uniref:hypothetical protein n=1 Tax=Yoonia sp. TaxID=2212373 RepID=UPI00358F1F64